MTVLYSSSLPKVVTKPIKDGSYLVGDDFNDEQLQRWLSEEQEAFYEADAGSSEVDPWYQYMRYVNEVLGFSNVIKHVNPVRNMLVLGPGSGLEIYKFSKANPQCKLHFLEASHNFRKTLAERFPGSNSIAPQYTGDIALPDMSQDVVCAFSVLHHIANVSKVIREIGRVTQKGGVLLVREPCSSMGDWRKPRSATPNERGIPKSLMIEFAKNAGFDLVEPAVPILFEPFNRLIKRTIGFGYINFSILYLFDAITSKVLSYNDHYWRDSLRKKLGRSSYFYVFKKPCTR